MFPIERLLSRWSRRQEGVLASDPEGQAAQLTRVDAAGSRHRSY